MQKPNHPPPEHLGDGAYVQMEAGGPILTANDHVPHRATDTVYLHPEAILALERYIARTPFGSKKMHGS